MLLYDIVYGSNINEECAHATNNLQPLLSFGFLIILYAFESRPDAKKRLKIICCMCTLFVDVTSINNIIKQHICPQSNTKINRPLSTQKIRNSFRDLKISEWIGHEKYSTPLILWVAWSKRIYDFIKEVLCHITCQLHFLIPIYWSHFSLRTLFHITVQNELDFHSS